MITINNYIQEQSQSDSDPATAYQQAQWEYFRTRTPEAFQAMQQAGQRLRQALAKEN